MKLSKTSALAALAVAHLAQYPESSVVQARQVAEHLGIPTDSALKILQTLARHHVIDSRLGRGGGYRLGRTAHEINLLEIVEAIDGPVVADVSLSAQEAADRGGRDVLESICQQLARQIRDQLSSTSVAQLVGQPVAPLLKAG